VKQSIVRLNKYNEIKPFFDELLQSGDLSTEFMSPFWKECLEQRHNFPMFNEIATFRRGMATNIGYKQTIKEDSEYVEFLLNFARTCSMTPLEYIRRNQESDVGLPYQFLKDGILSSSAGLLNVATAHRVEKALKDFSGATEYRILEIGAGYGGVAEILIRNLNPDIYVICDLPHNLFLAAYYLSTNYPDFNLYFIDKSAPQDIPNHSLVFTTPKGIELLEDRFTLVLNTYSFQEMTLSEINRYFEYIRQHLADDGLFYFLNQHGAAGAQKPSDYPFYLFSVEAWRPLPCPQPRFLRKKQHYQVILRRRDSDDQLPPYFDSITHTLSLLMFMGVDTNISTFCDRLIRLEIQDAELDYLESLHRIVTSKSISFALKQLPLLRPPDTWLPITFYVSGLLKLFSKNLKGAEDDFKQALLTGLHGLAKTRVLVCLGLLSYNKRRNSEWESYIKQAMENSAQFQAEFEPGLGDLTIEKFTRAYKFAFPNLGLGKRFPMPPILNRLARGTRHAFFKLQS